MNIVAFSFVNPGDAKLELDVTVSWKKITCVTEIMDLARAVELCRKLHSKFYF